MKIEAIKYSFTLVFFYSFPIINTEFLTIRISAGHGNVIIDIV